MPAVSQHNTQHTCGDNDSTARLQAAISAHELVYSPMSAPKPACIKLDKHQLTALQEARMGQVEDHSL